MEHILLPLEQASRHAASVDLLFYSLIAMSIFFTALIAVLVIFFAVKYKRPEGPISEIKRGTVEPEGHSSELIWASVPFFIGMGIFVWATVLYLETHGTAPKDSIEISVIGKQWMWKFEHPNGKREINNLHLPVNRPVKFTMISQDVIHNLGFPAMRMKQDVVPGRYNVQWFEPVKTGKFHIFCDQYCGTNHAKMVGDVYVMDGADYEKWLEGTAVAENEPVDQGGGRVASGDALLKAVGCRQCHKTGDAEVAPMLEGIFASTQTMQDGAKVVVDENYIRESILHPAAKIVRGYDNRMPSFAGRVSEEEIVGIIKYIKTSKGVTIAGKKP